jgi:hypothetical protein
MFRLDPNAGYFIPDSAIIYLPIQLCIWVAAYLKQASPDPPEDASRTVRAAVVIDSTRLLGELSVLPYNAPDRKSDQEAKGVKRSADSAPKASSHSETNLALEDNNRVLKRFLQVNGPASRPYDFSVSAKKNQTFLKTFARKHAHASDTTDFWICELGSLSQKCPTCQMQILTRLCLHPFNSLVELTPMQRTRSKCMEVGIQLI